MATIAKHIYAEKLKDINWQKKKNSIQIRDEFTCQKCGNKEGFLNVHHRHYLPARDPWDYPEQLLVLLCEKCHKEEEDCKDILSEMIPALHYWGYFNTDIRDIVNNLIQSKIPEKKMAKNPVFPLYYNDLRGATQDWTDEEFGAYVRLLIYQWDKKNLPNDYQRLTRIATSWPTNEKLLRAKFKETDDGLINVKLEEVRDKLLKHKKKQSDNVLNRYQTSTKLSTKNIPLEEEIENILLVIKEIVKEEKEDPKIFVMLVLKMMEVFKKHFPKYPITKDIDYPACLQIAYRIAELKHWQRYDVINGKMDDCLSSWKNIVKFIENDDWLSTRSLSDISGKEWQRLVQKMSKEKKKPEEKEQPTAPTLTQLNNGI